MARLRVSFSTPLHLIVDPPQEPSSAGAWVSSTVEGVTVKGKAPMAYLLPTDHSVVLQIAYKDAKGNAATVDGDVSWSSSDDTICKVAASPQDSTKAGLLPGANLGNAQISATADADLGEGVQEIITVFDVTVVAGSAVAGTITPGESTPIAKPGK